MSVRLEDFFEIRLREDPGQKILWWKGEWKDGNWVEQRVRAWTDSLRKGGFGSGSRLAVFLPNSPQTVLLSLAVWHLGGTLVPLNPRGGTEWILRILQHVDPFGVILGDDMTDLAQAVRKGGFPAESVSTEGEPVFLKGLPDRPDGDPALAVIFATSGTTGAPKAVPLTHDNLYDNTRGVFETIEGFEKGRVLMDVLPNFHSFGYTVCCVLPLLWGLPLALLPGFLPLKTLFEGLRSSETGILIAVPTMLPFLLGAVSKGETLPSQLRYILTGGGKLDRGLETRFRDQLGVVTYEGYGLTECSPVVSCNPSDVLRKTGTVGPALPGYETEVRSDSGELLPPGEEGVLWLRGPSVAQGYFKDPDLTEERFIDGWFNTGDMVTLDREGYITILDRVSDMIIVGGFNVYPQEVESVIREIPGVREAAVVGFYNAVSGEVPVAFVLLEEGAEVSGGRVISRCKKKMAHFKVPRKVLFVKELPLSPTGKVLRRKLREEFSERTGQK